MDSPIKRIRSPAASSTDLATDRREEVDVVGPRRDDLDIQRFEQRLQFGRLRSAPARSRADRGWRA